MKRFRYNTRVNRIEHRKINQIYILQYEIDNDK